jgi:hypothetical protein
MGSRKQRGWIIELRYILDKQNTSTDRKSHRTQRECCLSCILYVCTTFFHTITSYAFIYPNSTFLFAWLTFWFLSQMSTWGVAVLTWTKNKKCHTNCCHQFHVTIFTPNIDARYSTEGLSHRFRSLQRSFQVCRRTLYSSRWRGVEPLPLEPAIGTCLTC